MGGYLRASGILVFSGIRYSWPLRPGLHAVPGVLLCLATWLGSAQAGNGVLQNKVVWLKEEAADSSDTGVDRCLNFNPVLRVSKPNYKSEYDKIVGKESSLFAVIQCSLKDEANLLSLNRGADKIIITNKNVSSDKDHLLSKGTINSGILLSYRNAIHSFPFNTRGTLKIEPAVLNTDAKELKIMELLYFSRYLSNQDRNIVESYLSVKYGISLPQESMYQNFERDTIRNFKESRPYNYRVTAIGRNDRFSLLQKQSGNAEKDGLFVSMGKMAAVNSKNRSGMADNTFLFWGDNNGATRFDDATDISKVGRVWEMLPYAKGRVTFNTQISIDRKRLFQPEKGEKPGDGNCVWLVVDTTGNNAVDFTAARFVKPFLQSKDSLIYNNVSWNSRCHFSFAKARNFSYWSNKTLQDAKKTDPFLQPCEPLAGSGRMSWS